MLREPLLNAILGAPSLDAVHEEVRRIIGNAGFSDIGTCPSETVKAIKFPFVTPKEVREAFLACDESDRSAVACARKVFEDWRRANAVALDQYAQYAARTNLLEQTYGYIYSEGLEVVEGKESRIRLVLEDCQNNAITAAKRLTTCCRSPLAALLESRLARPAPVEVLADLTGVPVEDVARTLESAKEDGWVHSVDVLGTEYFTLNLLGDQELARVRDREIARRAGHADIGDVTLILERLGIEGGYHAVWAASTRTRYVVLPPPAEAVREAVAAFRPSPRASLACAQGIYERWQRECLDALNSVMPEPTRIDLTSWGRWLSRSGPVRLKDENSREARLRASKARQTAILQGCGLT